jgi:hypothetical protein
MLTCRLCSASIPDNPEGVPIVGLTEAGKFKAFIDRLGEHMQRFHPREFGVAALIADRAICLGTLANFESDDPKVKRWILEAAATVYQLVGRQLTDADIAEVLKKNAQGPAGMLALSKLQQRHMLRVMCDMRDWLSYADVLKPQNPPPGAEAQEGPVAA